MNTAGKYHLEGIHMMTKDLQKVSEENVRFNWFNCFSIYEYYSYFVCNDKTTSDALQRWNRTLESLIENETGLRFIFKK